MTAAVRAEGPRYNNIGILRLLLASLVIFGHAPEILDGNRSREPLTALLHSISLGELAVDGFFLISGFLITASMCSANSTPVFLWRRIRRICPGYLVAFLICMVIVAPALGVTTHGGLRAWLRVALLLDPAPLTTVAPGTRVASIDGAMWSISYEFRCYLTTLLLWLCGAFRHRRIFLVGVLCLTAAAVFSISPSGQQALAGFDGGSFQSILGDPRQMLRLETIYLIGSCFYLFEARTLRVAQWPAAAFCAVAAVVLTLLAPRLGEAWIVGFGSVVLFWCAFNADIGPLAAINRDWDISYGVYLYGWPASLILCGFVGVSSPVWLALLSLPLTWAMGAASWWGVEKWAKDIRIPHYKALVSVRRP